MKKKKTVVIIIVLLVILLAAAVVIFVMMRNKDKGSDELVYVESVENITGMGIFGDNRYMGVVESQETKGVDKAADKTVKEIFVEQGDEVKEGDPLFEYDTEEMNLQLKQMELELTSINTSISTTNQQIAALAAERDQAPAENKIEYTSQIQSLQAQVNQYNYDASAKQLEIDRQKAAMENSVVSSPMNGIIKQINKDAAGTSGDNQEYGSGSEPKSFIMITAVGDYRIKGVADELTVRGMTEGQAVIIRSRIDESVTWSGTITTIDLEHPEQNSNDYYMMDSSSSTMPTKYPFYISIDSVDGLMLGQHVYIEMDYGQGEAKKGLWLDEAYIMQEEDGSYVWTEDKDGRIEKRRVELGGYDEEMWKYEILSGLTEKDYIAFPEERIREGMKATHNYEDVMQYENTGEDDFIDDSGATDGDSSMDGLMDEGVPIGGDDVMPDGYTVDENGNILDSEGNIIDDVIYDSVDLDGDVDTGEGASE